MSTFRRPRRAGESTSRPRTGTSTPGGDLGSTAYPARMTSTLTPPISRGARILVRLDGCPPVPCDVVTVFPSGDIVARPETTDGVGILIERDFVDDVVSYA